METRTSPEEENHASGSSGSIIKIKAITIDLKFPKEMCETENFHHNFSILGYAAEMRTKNPKASNPFQNDGNLNDLEEQLPPLPVPKFRWWRCSECRRNMDIACANEETTLIPNNVSTSLNKVSGDDADVPSETPEGPISLSKDKEKVPAASNGGVADAEIEPVEAAANTDSDVRVDIEIASNKTNDVRDDQSIANAGGILVTAQDEVPHEGTNGVTDDVPVISEFQKGEGSGLSKLLLEEKMNSTDDEQGIAETPFSSSDPNQNANEVAATETVDSVALLQAEDVNNAMSDGDGSEQHGPVADVMSDSDQSEQLVPYNGFSRRKVRKVRLLADLLGEKGSVKSDHLREGDLTTSSKLLGPTRAATSLPHDQIHSHDVGRDANSPQNKGKMPQEEGGSPGQVTVAAKSNVPITKGDVEPTVKGSEVPSSGGPANASSGAGLQFGKKADRLKRKVERNDSLVKKKSKTVQVHDSFPPSKPSEHKSTNVKGSDIKRCSTTSNMPFSKTFASPSAAAEPSNDSRDYQSPRETDKCSNDAIQTALQIPNFTIVNDRSSRMGLLTLDSYPQRIGSSGNQDGGGTSSVLKKKNDFRLGESSIPPASEPDFLKKRHILDLNERATNNSSYVQAKKSFPMAVERDFFQEKAFGNQGPSESINEQCGRRNGKAVVQGSSDDIPMEIVELMAKNQYERALGNAGSPLVPSRTNKTIRRFPEVEDIRNVERPAVGYSGLHSFSFPNARSGMSIQTANKGSEKGNPMDYFQIGRNHFNKGQVDERQRSIFTAFSQSQQTLSSGRQFSATASVRSGRQRSEVVEPSSLSRATVMPFGLDSLQNFSAHAPESCHKGKTISDIKADELKKIQETCPVLPRPGAFELYQKLKGPLDPYANENIPAMQLLSLMDERSPGSTFSGGTSSFLDKAFTPGCYLKSNADGRTGFLSSSMFLQHNQAKESSGLGIGVRNAERPFAFPGALSLDPRGRDRFREKLQISGSAADVSYIGQTSSRGKDKQKAVVVYSDIAEGPMQRSAPDDTQRFINMETESSHENIMPLRSLPPNEFCSLNRNPAEFSIPEAGNEFTIHGRDIKFRKRKYSRSVRSSVRIDGPKQRRNPKAKAGKERGQNNEA